MPNRILKARVVKSEKLNAVSDGAQALWFRLLAIVDDYGRYDAKPSLVATGCYPLRNGVNLNKITAQLTELSEVGLIVLYSINGDKYLEFTKWDDGNIRAKNSKFPPPIEVCNHLQADASNCKQMRPYTDTYSDTDTDTESDTKGADKPPTLTQLIDAYTENSNLRTELREYVKARTKKRNTPTPHALDLIFKDLDRLAADDEMKIKIVKRSIKRGWAGVFPYKDDMEGGAQPERAANGRIIQDRPGSGKGY